MYVWVICEEAVCACACMYLQRPRERVRWSRTWVIGGCELPYLNAENWTQILHKSSMCFQPLNHFSNLAKFFVIAIQCMELLCEKFVVINKHSNNIKLIMGISCIGFSNWGKVVLFTLFRGRAKSIIWNSFACKSFSQAGGTVYWCYFWN